MKTPFWPIFFAVWLGGVAAFATVTTISGIYSTQQAKKQTKLKINENAGRVLTAAQDQLDFYSVMTDRDQLAELPSLETTAAALRTTAKTGDEWLSKDRFDALLELATKIDEAVKLRKQKR